MDAQKFGTFIANIRKEKQMTQLELAQKLHVTDKAVSRWERGVGFPDIHMLEPLAEVLGVSILELMHSERIEETTVPTDAAVEVLSDAFDLLRRRRKMYKTAALLLGFLGVGAALLLAQRELKVMAGATYDVRLLGVFVYGLIPIYVAALSAFITGAIRNFYSCFSIPKPIVTLLRCTAGLLLAVYAAMIFQFIKIIPVIFPTGFAITILSWRYPWFAVIGIIAGLTFRAKR